MKRVCIELKPSRLDDVIALVALYRPGPMEWIPQFINNKHGRTKAKYLHPKLEPILAETYSVACYQEQIMQIARDIAGFTGGEADELRKVMAKKKKDQMPIYREKFVAGSVAHSNISRELGEKIFAFVEPFAGYGFPKAHAAAYGWIAYQTAYLKASHPLQYLSALMTSVKDRTDKLVEYIDEAKKIGINVLPPDVNESLVDFAVVGKRIRFGLSAIKGVGENAVRSIIESRERDGRFTDLFDFARRVDSKQVNRRVFEALIKCGAFDGLPGNRAQKLEAVDQAIDVATRATRDAEIGQFSLFGDAAEHAPTLAPALKPLPPPTNIEMLQWEKETLGIFVSGHPIADVQELLVRNGATLVKDLRKAEDDAQIGIAGIVTSVRRTLTKAGQQMLIAQIEDTTGSVDVVVFAKLYAQVQGYFEKDRILTIKGRVRLREQRGTAGNIPRAASAAADTTVDVVDVTENGEVSTIAVAAEEAPVEVSVSANEVTPFVRPVRFANARPNGERPASIPNETSTKPPTREWHVTVTEREQIDRLAALLDEWPGSVPVIMHVGARHQQMPRTVSDDPRLRTEFIRVFGEDAVSEVTV